MFDKIKNVLSRISGTTDHQRRMYEQLDEQQGEHLLSHDSLAQRNPLNQNEQQTATSPETTENRQAIDAFTKKGVESLCLKEEAKREVQDMNKKMLKNLYRGVKNPEQKEEDLWIEKVGNAASQREKRLRETSASWMKDLFQCDHEDFWLYYDAFTEEGIMHSAKRDYSDAKDPLAKKHMKEVILAVADVFEEMESLANNWLTMKRKSRRNDEEMTEVLSAVDGKNFRAFLIASWEVRRRAWASEARFEGTSEECRQGKVYQDICNTCHDLFNEINGPNGQLWFHFFGDFQWDSIEADSGVPKFCELAQKIISYERFLEEYGIPTHPPYDWSAESYGGNAQ